MTHQIFKSRGRTATGIAIVLGILLAVNGSYGQTARAAGLQRKAAIRKPFRILCVGDSITQVQFNQGTIKDLGWNHTAGMAASNERKDYVHRLGAFIQKALPNRKVVLTILDPGYWGKYRNDATCTPQEYLHQALAPMKIFLKKHPPSSFNLIVFQHGESEYQPRGVAFMRTTYTAWMKMFTRGRHPIIICTGDWAPYGQKYLGWPKQVDHTMRRICRQWGGHFVSVEAVAVDPRNRGWGSTGPLRWHPNDRGHELYAIRIFRKFRQIALKLGWKLHPVTLPKLKP